MRFSTIRLGIYTALAFLAASPGVKNAGAQDIECQRGDLEVFRLVFEGNHAFSDADLAKTIVTAPSAWARRYLYLPFTVKHCLDRAELPNDRARLIIFYRRRGYPKVTVDTAVKELAPGAVEVKFTINEGPPLALMSFAILGMDSVPEKSRIVRGLPVREGRRFDRFVIDAAADTIRQRLHNNGYPRADVRRAADINVGADLGVMERDAKVPQALRRRWYAAPPMSFTGFPKGGERFFQRHAGKGSSALIEQVPVYGDHKRFVDTYFSTYKGKYFTGDGCRRDADGYYWITGRVDDVINVSGHRMGTAEVESSLVAHDAVSEAAVVGYPHDIKGQGIYAYVTLMAGFTTVRDAGGGAARHIGDQPRYPPDPDPGASGSGQGCPR